MGITFRAAVRCRLRAGTNRVTSQREYTISGAGANQVGTTGITQRAK